MFDCINNIEKLRREQLNTEARIHAIGWSGLFNGFKGEKDPDINFTDLLPFPDELNKNKDTGISEITRSIIKDIIKQKLLPIQTAALLAGLL